MSHSRTSATLSPPIAKRGVQTSWRQGLSSLGFGVLSTVVIFSFLHQLQQGKTDNPVTEIGDEISYSAMPPPPPPPSHVEVPVQTESSPLGMPTAPIAFERTDSPVKIAATPPDAIMLVDQAPAPMAAAVAQIKAFTPQAPRSQQVANDPNFIFERNEVDKVPFAVDRVMPRFRPGDVESTNVPFVNVLFVVEPNGQPSGVRLVQTSGSKGFDRAIIEAISRWSFSPAVRKGKKVRCWVQQNVRVKVVGTASPFGS